MRGLMIDLKQTLRSMYFWGSVIAVCFLTLLFVTPGRSVLDTLMELFKGPPYEFMVDGGLTKFMIWLTPHTLLSVLIGRETEIHMDCMQFRLPRYKSPLSFWNSLGLKTVVVCALYYAFIFTLVVLMSMLSGHIMPGVSGMVLQAPGINMDDTWLLLGALYLHTVIPMIVVLLIQSLLHIGFDRSILGGISFILLVAVSAFMPEMSFMKYNVGNWIIFVRSAYVLTQNGVETLTILLGSLVYLLLIAIAATLLFRNRNWY